MGLYETWFCGSNYPYTNFHELNSDWLIAMTKDMIKKFDELKAEFEGLEDEILAKVDAKLEGVDKRVNKIVDDKLAAYTIKVDAKLTAMQKSINDALDEIHNTDINLRAWVTSRINEMRRYVETSIQYLRELIVSGDDAVRAYVDKRIQEVIDMIPEITTTYVVNPFTYQIIPITEWIPLADNVYRYFGFTSAEYLQTNMTMAEYAAKEWTMYDYRVNARENYVVWNPIKMWWSSNQTYFNDLLNLHVAGSATMAWYAEKAVTMAQYADYQMTPSDYRFAAMQIMRRVN